MSSLDIESLFTNIPLSETIDICVNSLYKEVDKIDELNKEALCELLTLAITESFFLFDGKF